MMSGDSSAIHSTLLPGHSMRGSAESIQALIVCKSGHFITYDKAAVRLWSLKKQVKAWRPILESGSELKFSHISYIDSMDCCLVFFTPTRQKETKGGKIFLITSGLHLLQEITVKLSAVVSIRSSPNDLDFAILDKHGHLTILHVDMLQKWTGSSHGESAADNFFQLLDDNGSLESSTKMGKGAPFKNKELPKVKYLSVSQSQCMKITADSRPKVNSCSVSQEYRVSGILFSILLLTEFMLLNFYLLKLFYHNSFYFEVEAKTSFSSC
jgi:hypothetical protein